MALETQDFIHGIDMTVFPSVDGSSLNLLMDDAKPHEDTNGDGKGLTLRTKDTALNTPVVPDAADLSLLKWQRYLWIRVPDATADSLVPLIYAWNEDAVSDAIFLKWQQIIVDITTLQAAVDEAVADAANAIAIAQTAIATANAALIASTTAIADAAAALAAANSAATAAASAETSAAAAVVTADNALTVASNPKDVDDALNPGTAGQKIRTNSAATAVEWYNDVNQYVKVSYSPVKGTAPEISVATNWIKRTLVTLDSNAGSLATVASNEVTLLPGIYRVFIIAPAIQCDRHKAVLVDVDTNLVMLIGTNGHSTSQVGSDSIITGIITVTSVIKTFAVYHYTQSLGGRLGGSFTTLNIMYPNFGVDVNEVFLTCEFWKIN